MCSKLSMNSYKIYDTNGKLIMTLVLSADTLKIGYRLLLDVIKETCIIHNCNSQVIWVSSDNTVAIVKIDEKSGNIELNANLKNRLSHDINQLEYISDILVKHDIKFDMNSIIENLKLIHNIV